MGLNPSSNNTDGEQWKDANTIGAEGAVVTRATSHTAGDSVSHEVYVQPDTMETDVLADVGINQTGDVQIPTEGSRVMIAYRVTERPFVVAQRYQESDVVPDYEPGERVIGHPLSDAHVRLAADGTIHVVGDGDVVINDGNTQAITDVTAGGTNAEGGITSLDVTRSSSVYLPD